MTTPGVPLKIEAHAKINLTLEILGTRPDGYHDLRSIVMPVSLTDTLTLTSTSAPHAMTITVSPGVDLKQLGATEENLALRAARLMQTTYHIKDSARIHIHKRIPIGGGLGGGSADAAGVICGLNRLWALHRPRTELMSLGAELGSDVPALIHGGAVLMEGRGERIQALFDDTPPEARAGFGIIIANPGIMCSTKEVYKMWRQDLTNTPPLLHNMKSSVRKSDVSTAAEALYNGLQTAVFKCYPGVAQTARQLSAAGCLGVLLSGSGASVFGLIRDAAHGREISRKLGSGLWHVIVRTCPVV